MKVLRRMTSTQEKFRRELIKRDQSCILSNLCHEVCEAAHLVNKEWIETSKKDAKFTRCNGILLNSNLHKEFDLHYWTIDMNEESWDIIKKNLNIEQTSTYKCNIKLYPIGEKKQKTNMKLEIFNYIESGIEMPVECMPFIIKRNEVYKSINCTEKYSLNDINECLKTIYRKKRKIKKKNLKEKSKKSPKKIIRYSKEQKMIINSWINGFREKPPKISRNEFCKEQQLNEKVFESRFNKLWNKYNKSII